MLYCFTTRARAIREEKIYWWDNLVIQHIQELCWLAVPRPDQQAQIITLQYSDLNRNYFFWDGKCSCHCNLLSNTKIRKQKQGGYSCKWWKLSELALKSIMNFYSILFILKVKKFKDKKKCFIIHFLDNTLFRTLRAYTLHNIYSLRWIFHEDIWMKYLDRVPSSTLIMI